MHLFSRALFCCALTLLLAAAPTQASDVNSWSGTAAGNGFAPPDGWPAGGTMLPTDVEPTARELMAAIKRQRDRAAPTITSTGTLNAQVLTYPEAPTEYVLGDTYTFIAGFTNTASTSVEVNGLAAIPVRSGGGFLTGGEIVAGHAVTLYYDGTYFEIGGGSGSGGSGSGDSTIFIAESVGVGSSSIDTAIWDTIDATAGIEDVEVVCKIGTISLVKNLRPVNIRKVRGCHFSLTADATSADILVDYRGTLAANPNGITYENVKFSGPLWYDTDPSGVLPPPGLRLFTTGGATAPGPITFRHVTFLGGARHIAIYRGNGHVLDDVKSYLSGNHAIAFDNTANDADNRGQVNIEINHLQVYAAGKYGLAIYTNSGSNTQAPNRIRVKNSFIRGSGVSSGYNGAQACADITGTGGDYTEIELDVYDCGKGGIEAKHTQTSRAASDPGPLHGMQKYSINAETSVDSGFFGLAVLFEDGWGADPGPEIRKNIVAEVWARYQAPPDCIALATYAQTETCTQTIGSARYVYQALIEGKAGDLTGFVPPSASAFTASIAPVTGTFTGSITGTTLTVSAIAGTLAVGANLSGLGGGGVHALQKVTAQLTGVANGVGTYRVRYSQTLTPTTVDYNYGLMTVTAVSSGTLATNQLLDATLLPAGTRITQFAAGSTGGVGDYYLSLSQTFAAAAFVGNAAQNFEEGNIWWHYLGTEPEDKGLIETMPDGFVTGTGYTTTDYLAASGGTCTVAPIVQPAAVTPTGRITSFNVMNAGTCSVPPTNPVTLTGGSGSGATMHAQFSPIATQTGAAQVYAATDLELRVHAQRMASGIRITPEGSQDQTIWRGDFWLDGTVWGACVKDTALSEFGQQLARVVNARFNNFHCRSLGSNTNGADAALSLGHTEAILAWVSGPVDTSLCAAATPATGCYYPGNLVKADSGKTYVAASCVSTKPCAAASAGVGPSGTGDGIADGDVTWKYYGTLDNIGVQWDGLQINGGNIQRMGRDGAISFADTLTPISIEVHGGARLVGADTVVQNNGAPVTLTMDGGTSLAVAGKQVPLHTPFYSTGAGATGTYTSLGQISVTSNAAVGGSTYPLSSNASSAAVAYNLNAVRGYSLTAPASTACASGDKYISATTTWDCLVASTTAGSWGSAASGETRTQSCAAYTLLSTDNYATINCNDATNKTITLPDSFSAGFSARVCAQADGQITFSAAGGGTLVSPNNFTKTFSSGVSGQNGACVILDVYTNSGSNAAWRLNGNGA